MKLCWLFLTHKKKSMEGGMFNQKLRQASQFLERQIDFNLKTKFN